MAERNVLYFDFETTSHEVEILGIVQVAATLVRYEGITSIAEHSMNTLVDSGIHVEPEASSVHMLIDEDLVDVVPKMDSKEVNEFTKLASLAHYVSGHYIQFFDYPIAKRLFGAPFGTVPMIDTHRLAKKTFELLPSYTLAGLAYRFKLFNVASREERTKFHEAGFDVKMSRALLERCAAEHGISEIDDLFKYVNQVKASTVFSFGKYKGQEMKDVYTVNSKVFRWYLEQSWFAEKYPEEHAGMMRFLKTLEE